jgi:hypothetical protein
MTLYFFVNVHTPLFKNLFIYLFIICVFYFFVFLKSLYLFRGVCVVAVGVAWEGADSATIAAEDAGKRVGRGQT